MTTKATASLAVAALPTALGAASAINAPLGITFSVTNPPNGGGSAAAVVRDLAERTGAATRIEITPNSVGFGPGAYAAGPGRNV